MFGLDDRHIGGAIWKLKSEIVEMSTATVKGGGALQHYFCVLVHQLK